MPRLARTVFPGVPYHVTQRGNRREDVFFTHEDRGAYLEWMREYCTRHGVAVLAYCLMTNHIHVIVVPPRQDALENVFRPLHTRYAQHVNRARKWKGHLWLGRFFSSALFLLGAGRAVAVGGITLRRAQSRACATREKGGERHVVERGGPLRAARGRDADARSGLVDAA